MYECKLCDFNTKKLTNYNMHCNTIKHITNDKKNSKCYGCDKIYDTRRQYTKHRFNYHRNEENFNNGYSNVNKKIKNNDNYLDIIDINNINITDEIKNINEKYILDNTENVIKPKIITKTIIKTITKTIIKSNDNDNNLEEDIIPDIIEYTEDIEENEEIPKKKIRIPAIVRKIVWATYIGKNTIRSKCLCCDLEEISYTNFECGHVISEKNGGNTTIDNLRPICGHCNKSIGKQNMDEFMDRYNIKKPINWYGLEEI
jgi:5-methylcytosine-specific restriction endonuclease McrA